MTNEKDTGYSVYNSGGNGFLTFFGGLVIAFAKEILDLIL